MNRRSFFAAFAALPLLTRLQRRRIISTSVPLRNTPPSEPVQRYRFMAQWSDYTVTIENNVALTDDQLIGMTEQRTGRSLR